MAKEEIDIRLARNDSENGIAVGLGPKGCKTLDVTDGDNLVLVHDEDSQEIRITTPERHYGGMAADGGQI